MVTRVSGSRIRKITHLRLNNKTLKDYSFSNTRLLLFVLFFVVIGVYLLLQGNAATPVRNPYIPFGTGNSNDQNLSSNSYIYGIRFVLAEDTVMSKFISEYKAAGAPWDFHVVSRGYKTCTQPGSGCYGAGDGGTIRARLVEANADGSPNMSRILAEETFKPQTRYNETKTTLGISADSLFYYYDTKNVSLKAGTMYVLTLQNISTDPLHNFSSPNSVAMDYSASGPNGQNTLDPNATGAVAGLDPREVSLWSSNSGSTWGYGLNVGPYFGTPTGIDGTRIPHFGYVTSSGQKIGVQPYSAYNQTCSNCTLHAVGAKQAVTLTKAGGYGAPGASVGVVTVKNVTTGQTAQTPSLGGLMSVGNLSTPISVRVGDTVDITASGTVNKAMADAYTVQTFGLGQTGSDFPFTTAGSPSVAEVFALPWPFYRVASGPVTPPPPPPPPTTLTLNGLSSGQTVSGGVIASVDTRSLSGVAKAEYVLDGAILRSEVIYPYCMGGDDGSNCVAWDSNTVANGSHTVQVKVYDSSSTVIAQTAVINFSVNNTVTPPPPPPPSSDTTPPTVSVNGISSGSTVSATRSIGATASDNIAVTKVDFYLDNTLFKSEATSPYCFAGDDGNTCNAWDSTTVSDGAHAIYAKAYDAAGNVGTSATINFTVSNNPTTKPGDFNGDNSVNIFDLSIMLTNYGKTRTQSSAPACDMNNDNIINIFDLSILLSNYGK